MMTRASIENSIEDNVVHIDGDIVINSAHNDAGSVGMVSRHHRTIPRMIVLAVLSLVLSTTACTPSVLFDEYDDESGIGQQGITGESDGGEDTDDNDSIIAGSDAELLSSWDADRAPNYYAVTGGAVLPGDDALVPAGTIEYEGVDSLGRTGYAHGNITGKMIADSAGERQEFDGTADDISGWVNPRTGESNNGKTSIIMTSGNLDKNGDTRVYNGYFYNRSHLIADSLGGDATRVNLITGTRTQNVGDNSGSPGGMAYAEKQVREYLRDHRGVTCAYYAQPVYNGDELVPRGVTIDVRTSDDAVDEHVVVWNYANGHTIDYHTGAWK